MVFLLAADHGVARRGVSAYPAEVTDQMCRNIASGRAAINAIAAVVGARVLTVDMGVDADLHERPEIVGCKIRRGTRDLSSGAALTRDEVIRAILTGAELVGERSERVDLLALGEMGIGNTTAASAVAAAITGRPPGELVGRGTGVDDERLRLKRQIIGNAVRRCPKNRDALHALAQVGGLEIAGLAGVVLGAAASRRAVVTDGFIATTAALAAVRLQPSARDYLFASHRSTEPGHPAVLTALGIEPLFDLEMRLGEGTGAALALPMLDAAGAILREMATFESAGVSGPHRCT